MNAAEEMRALDDTVEILKKESDIQMKKRDLLRKSAISLRRKNFEVSLQEGIDNMS